MDNNQNSAAPATTGNFSLRRLALLATGLGIGSLLAYLFTKTRSGRQVPPVERRFPNHIVDDRGTGQEEAALILLNLRDRAFEASNEKLAIALGRPIEEVSGWYSGQEVIDDDVIMKARGIAMHRGVRVE
jgi:hypothetical protein